MSVVSFLPMPDPMLHDSMMGMFPPHDSMPLFAASHEHIFTIPDAPIHMDAPPFERLFLNESNDSPPESPSYSTSDASSEEYVDFVQSPKEFNHDTMWSSHGHNEMFLSSSVSWVPEAMEADSEFASLVQFASDDSVVAIDELSENKVMLPEAVMLPEVEEDVKPKFAMLKRKASVDSFDERPMKKSKSFSRSSSPSPSSSLDMSRSDDPEAKRLTHNVLERRRRNDLKNSYQQLRVMIPSLEDNERAPTGQILIHAVDHITALKGEEQCLLAELAAARAENDRLRAIYGMN